MKTYNSFVVRTWTVRVSSGSERHVVDVQHVQTGDSARFARMDSVLDWLAAACGEAEEAHLSSAPGDVAGCAGAHGSDPSHAGTSNDATLELLKCS